MAENVVLQLILDGISTLETKADLDAVSDAVKDRSEKLKVRRSTFTPPRFLTEEEKLFLAKGNSDEQIRVNKERYDYSNVPPKPLPMAEKWFKAAKPAADGNAYYSWRVWNAPTLGKKYKGHLITEKATGRSISPPPWESEGEGEEEDEEEVTEEVRVAMAAVRVE